MKVAVVGGTGYVGLITAVCLAAKGNYVFCVGRSKEKVGKIASGIPIVYEENLREKLNEVLEKNNLIATTDLKSAIQASDISFICVGTPSTKKGDISLTQVKEATEAIGYALVERDSYHVVVVKSTVIPGTTEEVVIPTLEKLCGKRTGLNLGVCMNPEFLREGHAIKDFLFPKGLGIVIGEFDKKSGDVLYELYRDFDAEVSRTSIRAAEMIKYARNSYLAKDISFANEIANICQKIDVDYLDVKRGMEMDNRIGRGRFLDAGAGFGGSCFPKDVRALVAKAKEVGVEPRLLEATLKVNEAQPYKIIELSKKVLGNLNGKKIAILGLAFKPGTDDLREAPSIKIVDALLRAGAEVHVFDPAALDSASKIFGNKIDYAKSVEYALSDMDACIIITEWPEFSDYKLYKLMRGRLIIDGRRILNPHMLSKDFSYFAIGFPEGEK